MSEEAVIEMSSAINRQAARTRADGQIHDATFAFKEGFGITFQCTDEPVHVAGPRLKSHCKLRKYREKAERWFGLCMSSTGPDVRFGVSLTHPWTEDQDMNERTRDMAVPIPIEQALSALLSARSREKKAGRNDPCPCGSGSKYKKRCLS